LLIGHGMGVFLVGYATAWDAEILGVGMIAASNLGLSTMRAWARDPQEVQARFRANASRLAGTTSEKLLEEVKQNATSGTIWSTRPHWRTVQC
jgi:hypothetical protein